MAILAPAATGAAPRRPGASRAARVVGRLSLAAAVGFALVWSFLAYLGPGMVLDFASLMQMCGIPVSR